MLCFTYLSGNVVLKLSLLVSVCSRALRRPHASMMLRIARPKLAEFLLLGRNWTGLIDRNGGAQWSFTKRGGNDWTGPEAGEPP